MSLTCKFSMIILYYPQVNRLIIFLYFQFYIDPYKLLPLQRFLPRPPGEKGPPRGGGRGGRGGGRGGVGRGGRGGKLLVGETF